VQEGRAARTELLHLASPWSAARGGVAALPLHGSGSWRTLSVGTGTLKAANRECTAARGREVSLRAHTLRVQGLPFGLASAWLTWVLCVISQQ
jgi:hypothetical protein